MAIPAYHLRRTTTLFTLTIFLITVTIIFTITSNHHSNTDVLQNSWIVIAGDSQARLITLSLLRLLLDPVYMEPISAHLFRRHSDYHLHIPSKNLTVDFMWAPYETNITTAILGFAAQRHYPDVLVLGSGLWHMLHVNDVLEYGAGLIGVKRAVKEFGRVKMFWIGLPELVEEKLNTEEKRERMGKRMREGYEMEVERSGILKEMFLLDVGKESRRCGRRCTEDGMHYDEVVYEGVVRVMLDVLMKESRQRI